MNKVRTLGVGTAIALILSLGMWSVPADAQQQGGLVNVSIGSIETGQILSQNRVGVQAALQLVANVCPAVAVNVGAIVNQVARTGQFRCENEAQGRFAQVVR